MNNLTDKTVGKLRGKPFQKGEDSRRNLKGRSKGSYSLITILKRKLAKVIKKKGIEAGEELVQIWLDKARNEQGFDALKEIVRYTDGMPKQGIEFAGEGGGPIQLGVVLKAIDKIYGKSDNKNDKNGL